MPDALDNLTAEEKRILKESFREAFGEAGSEKRQRICREMADSVGMALKQEYRRYKDTFWLFTLGKPARPLTADEINYARRRGKLPH